MEGGCCDRHLFRNAKWVGMSHFAMRNDLGLMGEEARGGGQYPPRDGPKKLGDSQ